jgi:hypothetical protein
MTRDEVSTLLNVEGVAPAAIDYVLGVYDAEFASLQSQSDGVVKRYLIGVARAYEDDRES